MRETIDELIQTEPLLTERQRCVMSNSSSHALSEDEAFLITNFTSSELSGPNWKPCYVA